MHVDMPRSVTGKTTIMQLSKIEQRLPAIDARQRDLVRAMWSALLPADKERLNGEYQALQAEKVYLQKSRERMLQAGLHS